jgi:DNA helicase-2/ATP-dependent DNA helicase PcrA
VAMTRAKTDLHLITPLKFYVTQQSRMGDRHVYGAKSRFMTKDVLRCCEEVAFGEYAEKAAAELAKSKVDVAAKLKGMWA